MKLRVLSYLLIVVAVLVVVSLVGVGWLQRSRPTAAEKTRLLVQARRPISQIDSNAAALPTPQVVLGAREAYTPPPESSRYIYRNDFPADRSQLLPLYLIDTQTGAEKRLGDSNGAAVFGAINERYLLWFFFCNSTCPTAEGLHAYHLTTGEDKAIAKQGSNSVPPQILGNWLAFGRHNGGGSQEATLYAANIETQEVITLTRNLPAGNDRIRGYFGISSELAAWYEALNTIVVYNLTTRQEITRLTHINVVFNETYLDVSGLSPGETVVTWSRGYGYDLVTRSYFRLGRLTPPDWDRARVWDISRIQEQDRLLSWTFDMRDGSQRHIRAPLLDATPSTAPCVAGQNLVQNGDLEDPATHPLWQQSNTLSDLIVNDLPANLPQAGQWAMRLGRYSNAQQAIQQTLNIPSHVKGITLAFDVRVHSWDLWGGDQLQIDLVDPITDESILETPVVWTNLQLATGDWVPLQVEIQNWPGIDTPLHLVFRAQTDWAFPTDFTLDNIRFVTSCQ